MPIATSATHVLCADFGARAIMLVFYSCFPDEALIYRHSLAVVFLGSIFGGTPLLAQSTEPGDIGSRRPAGAAEASCPTRNPSALVRQFTADKNAAQGHGRDPVSICSSSGGTEAVTADYPAGRLVIVEYTTPQSSVEIDTRIQQHLATTQSPIVYRRIGNYNAFVFGAADPIAQTHFSTR